VNAGQSQWTGELTATERPAHGLHRVKQAVWYARAAVVAARLATGATVAAVVAGRIAVSATASKGPGIGTNPLGWAALCPTLRQNPKKRDKGSYHVFLRREAAASAALDRDLCRV
jgi:hypothetical protein